jgi:RHS repeat-associated protein
MARFAVRLCLPHSLTLGCTAVLLATFLSPALAQINPNLETGFKPFGSYDDTSLDSVSVTNGNLIVHIPIFDYPQRGQLKARLMLTYNGKGWQDFPHCLQQSCSPAWEPNNLALVKLQWDGGEIGTTYSNATLNGRTIQIYSAITSDGAFHPLAVSSNGGYESMDGSGIFYNGPTLLNRAGNGFNSSLTNWQDTNGNYLISNPGNGQTTAPTPSIDTLGRSLQPTTVNDGSGTAGCATGTGFLPVTSATIGGYIGPNGAQRLIKTCSATINLQTAFNAYYYNSNYNQLRFPIAERSGNMSAIQSVIVYDGVSWTSSPQWSFQYATNADGSNYGDLTQITLPTGGTIKYSWGTGTLCGLNPPATPVSRMVLSRTLNANDGVGNQTSTYSGASGLGVNSFSNTVTDAANNDTGHGISGIAGSCSLYETETDYFAGTGAGRKLLKSVQTAYTSTANPFDVYGDGTATAANVEPTSVTTKWPIPNTTNFLVSQVQTDWDQSFSFTTFPGNPTMTTGGTYGLPIETREYGYAVNSPGLLLRKTDYTYAALSNSNYLSANLLDLVTQKTVYDGSGSKVEQTNYTYDGTTLQSPGVTEQHASLANPGYRGNLTLVQEWLNTTGGLVTTQQTSYYDTGMPYQATDVRNNLTTYSYSSANYGAYLTQTQYPNTGSPAVSHSISGGYDFNTGLLTSFTDQNSQTSNYNYDLLGRMTSASYPDGGSVGFSYTDTVPWQIQKTVAITNSVNKVTNSVFDGLGRVSETQLLHDPDCTTGSALVKVDYAYGNDTTQNTHYNTVTTPYCDTPGTVFGLPTRTDSDALGRVAKVTETDGSLVTTSYAANTTGFTTTVSDEAGITRKSQTDGLGRLAYVWEDPNVKNFETDYLYSTLGNLTSVTQKGDGSQSARTRSFTYDSLSRLLSATNPESGLISYTYSNSPTYSCAGSPGIVCTRTAPLPNQTGTATVTTTNTYDQLNRLTSKSYKDGNNPDPYTVTAQFGYDGSALSGCTIAPPGDPDTYPTGRRTSMCDGSGGTSWVHDKMGRVKQERRSVGAQGVNHYIDYTFNLDGSLGVLQTPPMKTLNYTYSRAGRSTQLVDSTDSINFALNATYAPPGELTAVTLGSGTGFNGFTVANAYNNRLQPTLLSATNSTTGSTVFSDSFDFHLGAGDNGNVYKVVNNRDTTHGRDQNFTYDSLNRILSGQSSGTGGTSWGDTYVIDPWGNLTNMNPISGKGYGQNFQAAPASVQNQLNGYCNDSAGNLVLNTSCPQPPGTAFTPTYYYDAENRLVWTSGYRYIYDADGQRVEKCQAASATTACPTSGTTGTLYWRGTGSETLAETDLGGIQQEEYIFFNGERIARRDVSSTGATVGLHYYFSDHLGTHGVVETLTTSGTTSCDQDIDYYPYGGEENDYCTTPVLHHHKFTGKERDTESGLDNFGARYHASSLGRFMTPDWAAKPVTVPYAHFGNPQSLNLYSYVQNNPTTMGDPDGHCPDDSACSKVTVTVTKDAEPHVMYNQGLGPKGESGPYATGVGTTVTVKFSDSKGDMSKLSVKETPTTKDNLTGQPVQGRANPEPAVTTSSGTMPDVVMRGSVSAEKQTISEDDKADIKNEATTPYSHTTNQTLTFSTGGQTCQCTYSETLSNVDSKGNSQGANYSLTITKPEVKQKDPQSQ